MKFLLRDLFFNLLPLKQNCSFGCRLNYQLVFVQLRYLFQVKVRWQAIHSHLLLIQSQGHRSFVMYLKIPAEAGSRLILLPEAIRFLFPGMELTLGDGPCRFLKMEKRLWVNM